MLKQYPPPSFTWAHTFIVLLTTWCLSTLGFASNPIHPIYSITHNCLLGASTAKGTWLNADDAFKQTPENLIYQVTGLLSIAGKSKGSKVTMLSECGGHELKLATKYRYQPQMMAIAAPWPLHPRKVVKLSPNNKTYQQLTRKVLARLGVKHPHVRVKQIFRMDLEGDGQQEVLVSATNQPKEKMGFNTRVANANYSVVYLRHIVKGKVVETILDSQLFPEPMRAAPHIYQIAGVYDLNGDDKMEILISSNYYEGSSVHAYALVANKHVALPLGCGCGV